MTPTELAFTCGLPPDSPLTPFNETALFDGGSYRNYSIWGELAGKLGQLYPHLVAIDIDDFSDDVGTYFSGDDIAQITARMRAISPWMGFASVTYHPFAGRFPDLALMLDAPLFFFRDMVQCATVESCPCADQSCPWGPRFDNTSVRKGQCLAGACSEPTVPQVAAEIAAVAAGMPPARQMIVGYYATGHSTGGQPTPRYVSRLLQTVAAQPRVDGALYIQEKRCISRAAWRSVSRCSLRAPPRWRALPRAPSAGGGRRRQLPTTRPSTASSNGSRTTRTS